MDSILIIFYLDRIYQSSLRYAPARRIVRIIRPSAERPLAAGENIPDNPACRVEALAKSGKAYLLS